MLYLIEEISTGEDSYKNTFVAASDKEAIDKFTYSYDEGYLTEISNPKEPREVATYEDDPFKNKVVLTINEETVIIK